MNKELLIINIENNIYTLKDNENEYKYNINFINIDIKVNDKLLMNEELLKELNTNITQFGPIDSIYGKDVKTFDTDLIKNEIIILLNEKGKTYLKRVYG